MRGLRERTSLAFAINGRARAREDWKEHAGILAAVIDGDEELAALLADAPRPERRRGLRPGPCGKATWQQISAGVSGVAPGAA